MTKKLRKKRIGPLKVLRKIGDLNYQVELPASMVNKNIHDVFHVNLLTKAPKDTIPGRVPPKPLPIMVDSEEEREVERILDSRMNKRRLQYLVKWKDSPTTENSWEPAINLKNAPDIQ